jgi:uncharacterized protein YeaO (DUF488 family)
MQDGSIFFDVTCIDFYATIGFYSSVALNSLYNVFFFDRDGRFFVQALDIRVDCYLAVLKRFKLQFPSAWFEIVTRSFNSPLSPSWTLLEKYKSGLIDFQQFLGLLGSELAARPASLQRVDELARMSGTLFLVCYEKDASKCHRTFIKGMVETKRRKIEEETA